MKKKIYINKTLIALIIFNSIEAVSILSLLLFNYFSVSKSFLDYLDGEHILLLLILLIVLINSVLTIRDVRSLSENHDKYYIIKDSLRQVENLNTTLRAQRHDFMNHLQVVHGLIDMEEFKEAKNYIEKIFDDIQRVNNFLKTSNPAVNALLQAKILDAEKNKINVTLSIKSPLKNIIIPSWELCRVLGNILDNAIYALKEVQYEKVIEVNLFEDLKTFVFIISNNGPHINNDIINSIFKPGFTTKGAYGQGMGLYICQQILLKYGGGIKVKSDDVSTEFHLWFKK